MSDWRIENYERVTSRIACLAMRANPAWRWWSFWRPRFIEGRGK